MKSLKASYYAASYSRVSKEDGDKAESDSIKNQKELIRNFQQYMPEIIIVEEYSDDGYSGVNFERPGFQKMMEDVKAKKINCIIVKDLSRFGRNYIETGRYMEQILPFLGVRLIAVNDHYDSAGERKQSDQILLPFKNLINDSYCRDISIKIRSNLNAKRRRGDFVGAFAPYGYQKSGENKNKLDVDPVAAQVVKRIFQMKIYGINQSGIADRLNEEGIPTPLTYKRHSLQGKNYKSGVYSGGNYEWSVSTLNKILKNEVYLGHLVQGKRSTPNYKVKRLMTVEQADWIRVENTHEAIITQTDFDLVKRLLLLDTRVSQGKSQLYLLSGILMCANCKEALIRRTVSSKGGKYTYYGCYARDRKLKCKGIVIRESVVEEVVLAVIRRHIELLVEIESLLSHADNYILYQSENGLFEDQIQLMDDELLRYKKLAASLDSDFQAGLLEQSEYNDLKIIYTTRQRTLEKNLKKLLQKKQDILNGKSSKEKCIRLFKEYKNIPGLNRKILVMLVSSICITNSKKIEICFSYQDELDKMLQLQRLGKGD